MNDLTIGKVSAASGVTTDTIRFYEKCGLVCPNERSQAGYRLYSADVLDRLKFISRAKSAGFSLDDISQLLTLKDNPQETCKSVYAHAQKKRSELETKIRDLTEMRETLSALLAKCSGEGPLSECPILDSFDRAEPK